MEAPVSPPSGVKQGRMSGTGAPWKSAWRSWAANPLAWIFGVFAMLGVAGLLGGILLLVPLFARELVPAYSKAHPSAPSSVPGPAPKTGEYEELMAAAASLQKREDFAGALKAYADIDRAFPGNKQPRERMEMIAALLRSNAFVMTPPKFARLRSAIGAAAACDVVSAQMLLGEQLRDISPEESLKSFKAAARSWQTEAMTQAGLMLSNGRGTSAPDLRLAVEWFERASAEGDSDAMTALAECLIHGKGIQKNPRRAAELLRTASAFHQPRALNLLGDLYARGLGAPQDFQQAYELFSRSAAQGFGEGVANVGALTMRGEGVAADPKRAIEIWKSGIERGFPACMVNYAKALESGKGVAPDAALARHWYIRAARGENAEAIAWCRDHKIAY